MEKDLISERFNQAAEKYDNQRKFFIPCFDDYYKMSISFLSGVRSDYKKILDLGAGTGLLTKYIFEKFPDAHFTLVDLSAQMLQIAKERFFGLERFNFVAADYSKELPGNNYDLVASALSIHHLENSDKLRLYSSVYNKLETNGCFINLDQFNASSERMNDFYSKWWYDHICKSKIEKNDLESWLKRRELDRENTLDETKVMLKQAGFRIIECIYSYLKFSVILAIK